MVVSVGEGAVGCVGIAGAADLVLDLLLLFLSIIDPTELDPSLVPPAVYGLEITEESSF